MTRTGFCCSVRWPKLKPLKIDTFLGARTAFAMFTGAVRCTGPQLDARLLLQLIVDCS